MSEHQLESFITYLCTMLRAGRNYEVVQAQISVFLNAHAETIVAQVIISVFAVAS